MKRKELESLLKELLPNLPGFAVKGALLFQQPIGPILKGVYLDTSINSRKFYAQLFVQPLFVPVEYLTFSFGWRLDNRSWDADAPDTPENLYHRIRKDGLPFLSRVSKPLDFIDLLNDSSWTAEFPARAKTVFSGSNSHYYQTLLYASIREGKYAAALIEFDRLKSVLNMKTQWQQDMLEESTMLLKLFEKNPVQAQLQLDKWVCATIRNLDLENYRAPIT